MIDADAAPLGHVGLATAADAPAIGALLLAQYRAAKEFRLLRPDLLAWDGRAGAGGVAAGWTDDGRLVATMRASIAPDADAAAAAMGLSVDLPDACFPAVILSRAATDPALARSGINSLLRWHLLRAAAAQGARAALGLVYEGAPRLSVMARIGYRTAPPARIWDPEVEPLRPPLLAWLPPEVFPAAIEALRAEVVEAARRWPWHGPAPMVPSV